LLLVGAADTTSSDALARLAARSTSVRAVPSPTVAGLAAALNAGLEVARGEFVAVVGEHDLLSPDALARVASRIEAVDDLDVVYSDDDVVTAGGAFEARSWKAAWSPELLRSHDYCRQLSVLRTVLVRQVGGVRRGFEGAELHDLLLRTTEQARSIEHLPQVLYHRRAPSGPDEGAGSGACEGGRRAVQGQLARAGIQGDVEITPSGTYRTRRVLPAERRVSIVIPTRGSDALVWGRRTTLVTGAVRSALAATRHQNLEVVIVYDTPTPPAVLDELRDLAGDRLVLVPYDDPFNYSRKMNLGVLASSGDRIVLLNDDVQVRSEGWLEELVAPLEQPDVGMTGAKLYFSSTAIQHAGLAFSNGRYVHPYRRAPEDTPGMDLCLLVDREVSGVTGACAALRREVYLEVGGLTEQLAESFNDVDFSYKISHAGYRTLFLAHCELFHFESQTRDPVPNPDDDRFVRDRWGMPTRDPFTPVYPDLPSWADRNVNLQRRN